VTLRADDHLDRPLASTAQSAPTRRANAGLHDALSAAMKERLDGRRITHVRRKACSFYSSYPLEELELELDDGSCIETVWKDLSPRTRLKAARGVKPRFVYDPQREIAVYRHVLNALNLGTAEFHGASLDQSRRRYWLFLENVRGRHLWQFGEFDVWLEAARWIARMHVRGMPIVRDWRGARLMRYDVKFYRRWALRARQHMRRSPAFSPEQIDAVERISASYAPVAQRLAAYQPTFIHGEFYPSNILIDDAQPPVRVRPVDWEMAAVAPGCLDLAALSAGWDESRRNEFVDAYRGAMREAAPTRAPSIEEVTEQLEYGRLHLAMQWLGWSRRWSPPREHVQDWVAQAVSAAEGISRRGS
jgi:Ser/Thr protein kinase RdoA (MazF antagonist)